jgi:hypothetical protein
MRVRSIRWKAPEGGENRRSGTTGAQSLPLSCATAYEATARDAAQGRPGNCRSRADRKVRVAVCPRSQDPRLISGGSESKDVWKRSEEISAMEELLARVTARTGLDAATAQTAIGHILAFLQKEGPETEVNQLLAALPGSESLIAESNAGESGGGGLMGMLGGMMGGGGVMALGQKLMAAGVPMGQMQPLGQELFAFGREKVGEDAMGPIIGSIPGLNQFV